MRPVDLKFIRKGRWVLFSEEALEDMVVLDRGVLTAEYCEGDRRGTGGFFGMGFAEGLTEGVGCPHEELAVLSKLSFPTAA